MMATHVRQRVANSRNWEQLRILVSGYAYDPVSAEIVGCSAHPVRCMPICPSLACLQPHPASGHGASGLLRGCRDRSMHSGRSMNGSVHGGGMNKRVGSAGGNLSEMASSDASTHGSRGYSHTPLTYFSGLLPLHHISVCSSCCFPYVLQLFAGMHAFRSIQFDCSCWKCHPGKCMHGY